MHARIQQLSQLVPDKRIHNYAFSTQAVIGRGAYGVVYVGRQIETNQTVAIKAVPFQHFSPEHQTLLQKEIDIMKDLDCPNIVRLIDVLTTTNNCYIISELCTGGDLREFMKRSGPIDESRATRILIQILRGILQSFKRGIIHRDLKPANILIAGSQTFKIADFGFAKRFDKLDEDLMTSLVGTPLYMSPQVLLRRQYTSKCDVWSIGLIFYEMLEGKTPWNVRDILDLVNKQRNSRITFSKHLSKNAQSFIVGCLAYEENNRLGWEQVFTHPLFENAFERPKKQTQTQFQAPAPDPVKPPAEHGKTDPHIVHNKSMQLITNQSPPLKMGGTATSPLQLHNENKQMQIVKQKHFMKTGESPFGDEENKQKERAMMCLTQPNTLKKDRTVSVAHHKVESQQVSSRYSDNKPSQFRSERTHYPSEPKFQRQVSEADDIHQNRQIIYNQVEYLRLLRSMRHQLLEVCNPECLEVEKMQFIFLKNVMIKTTDMKQNLIDKQINIIDLRDFEHYKMTENFRQFEKQILEVHYETFNLYQENFLYLNGNMSLVLQDQDFQEVVNNNFEYSIHFAKLAFNIVCQLVRNYLSDRVLEGSNAKVINFTYLLCLYAAHVSSMNFNDVSTLLNNCKLIKEDFRQNRLECLQLVQKLAQKSN